MKTVKFNATLLKRTLAFIDDELNYHINESGCAEDYHGEILAQLEILYQLGEVKMAHDYVADYKEYLDNLIEDTYESGVRKRCKTCKRQLKDLWAKLTQEPLEEIAEEERER